jgi:hypothetical protein
VVQECGEAASVAAGSQMVCRCVEEGNGFTSYRCFVSLVLAGHWWADYSRACDAMVTRCSCSRKRTNVMRCKSKRKEVSPCCPKSER